MYLPPSLGSVCYVHEKGQRHAPVRYAECAKVVWTDLERLGLFTDDLSALRPIGEAPRQRLRVNISDSSADRTKVKTVYKERLS
jgi:hypothetical protein